MGWKLRYRCEVGQQWVENHRLVRVEQQADGETTGEENSWVLHQEVLKVQQGRYLIAWKRRDIEELEVDIPKEAMQGELWIDSFGSASPDGQIWSPALFPTESLEIDQVWTQERSALGVPIHFKLESADERSAALVSYAEAASESARQVTRGSTVLCIHSGRVLRSTTVTKVEHQDGAEVQTVVEVVAEGVAAQH